MSHSATTIKISRDEKLWELELSAQIPWDALAKYREEALKELQKDAKLDGFRQGHVPIDRIVQLYGEPAILRLAAERAIQHELPEILASENALIVETPRVQTDTPESGKPLAFTARAGLPPEVKLPDWKKIAKEHNAKKEDVSITDDEHAEALTHLRRERARIENMQGGMDAQKALEAARSLEIDALPAFDDEFAQSVGYENAEIFSQKMRENMKSEKEARARERRRTAILEDIAKKATIRYPHILLEYELDDMESRLSDDLARMGTNFERYLQEVKKTREEARKEWSEAADRRAKIRLILAELAKQENISADESKMESELRHAKEHYPEASEANLRAGIAHALKNEAVMQLLESQA